MAGSGYPKITEDRVDPVSGEWVALEKIHGAQLAVSAHGGHVIAQARKRDLTPEDFPGFFGLESIWPELVVAYRRLECLLPHLEKVFGELVGINPHTGQPVQPQTHYSDQLSWIPFDIVADQHWLSWDELTDLSQRVGLTSAPLIARGTYQRLAAIPLPETSSLLLPGQTPPTNMAEGLVLKPACSWSYQHSRPILKRKQPHFAEDGRWPGPRPTITSDQLDPWLLDQAAQRLTPTRVNNARSKLGLVDNDELWAEVVTDLLADLGGDVGRLDAQTQSQLRQAVNPVQARLLMS